MIYIFEIKEEPEYLKIKFYNIGTEEEVYCFDGLTKYWRSSVMTVF